MEAYTLGCRDRSRVEVIQLADQHDAVLVDIRFSGHLAQPAGSLDTPFDHRPSRYRQDCLDGRYLWIRELSNAVYPGLWPFRIIDLEAGLDRVASHLARLTRRTDQPWAAMFMCACPSIVGCHRSAVSAAWADGSAESIVHIPPAGVKQLTLF